MRLIDADTKIKMLLFDEMYEEQITREMTVEEALDLYTEDGCPTTVDAEPIRHGKWIVDAEDWRHQIEWFICSQCDFPTSTAAYKYCPNCGAIMEEFTNEADL